MPPNFSGLIKQYLIAGGGILVTILLFFFAKTSVPNPQSAAVPASQKIENFNIESFIEKEKATLTPAQTLQITNLEKVVRGDVKTQTIESFESLANYWKDSLQVFEPYAWYTAEAAKLANSEKNLNFAGQLFLSGIRAERDPSKISWETAQAIELFERALAINPANTESRIGLGSAYIFGNASSGDPQKAMKGIQELLSVVKEDSTNMRAQLMLGIGAMVSGQNDRAIERLEKVVQAQPNNMEAIAFLADAYAAAGQKQKAIQWYEVSKKMITDPHYVEEVDKRIKELQTR